MAHRLRVLGPPEVLDAAGKPVSLSLGKPLAVLVYVACSSSPVSRDELADLLWPDADRQKGRHSVRQALWVLKNALGDDIFDGNEPLSIREGSLELDLTRFSRALKDGRVGDAIALWRGPVLDHFVLAGVRHWNHWAEDLRGDLEYRFCKALQAHARTLASEGDTAGAVSALDQAIQVSPVSEAPHLARIELLLDLLRLDAAREALADAHQALGEHGEASAHLAAMEERLALVIKEQRARIEEGESFPMEFVGRSRELAGLQSLWREAHTGLTRTAVVTGPSGIGKTRLAQELLSYVAGQEVRIIALKGTRAGMKLRWGAASDLVREALRFPGSAGISSASDSLLRAMLPSLGKGAIDLQTVNGMSPAAFLDAVSDLFEAVSFETPIVVLIDDFQWLDRDSRTLFMGLASRCRELRVLFLILGRSELSSRHWAEVETALVSEAGARRFLLEPLIEEEVGELLALGAAFPNPEDARDVVRRIHQASAGNPLFIREILRGLHEDRILVRDGPGWVFQTSEIPDVFELPESLKDLLQQRLDRLSEAAASLAATLAKAKRRTDPQVLQRETQLPKGVFGKAVAELLERGVIEWVDGTSLDFVHDVLRDTAASHLSGSLPDPAEASPSARTRLGALAASAALVVVVLSTLWWAGVLPGNGDPPPPRYGGGLLLFGRQALPPVEYHLTDKPPTEWTASTLQLPKGVRVLRVFTGLRDSLMLFGVDEPEGGPDMARIGLDGSRSTLFPAPGDQVLRDLSPDRSRLLFTSENVGTRLFSASLFVGALDGSWSRLLYRGSAHVNHTTWSPDGDLVAFVAPAAEDTVVVISLQGERVGELIAGDVSGLSWCGHDLVVASSDGTDGVLFRSPPPFTTRDTLVHLEPGSSPACSPDGTAFAYVGIRNRQLQPLIMELESGEVHLLPVVDGPYDSPVWQPRPPPPIPVGVRVPTETMNIDWGAEPEIGASVVLSDGSMMDDGIRWESLDPEITTVGPYNELNGNGVGSGRVVARWGHSLADTLIVNVLETGDGGEIVRDVFETLDTTVWKPLGDPAPEPALLDGLPALRFLGNAKYNDGLLLRSPISLERGVTVEFDFKIAITEPVHQNIAICIKDVDWERSNLERGSFFTVAEACARYPALEHAKLDRSEVALTVAPGRERLFRVPDELPTDQWTHMALQIRGDGFASVVINRQRVGESPLNLRTNPHIEWHIVLTATVEGTELHVRNLNAWEGERY